MKAKRKKAVKVAVLAVVLVLVICCLVGKCSNNRDHTQVPAIHTHTPTTTRIASPTAMCTSTPVVVATVRKEFETKPSQTPRPTQVPTVATREATVQTTREVPTATLAPRMLELVSLTSPIGAGSTAMMTVRAWSGASCTPSVIYKSGRSDADGLYTLVAKEDGLLSWTWVVGARTTPGVWKVNVACVGGTHAQWDFVVR